MARQIWCVARVALPLSLLLVLWNLFWIFSLQQSHHSLSMRFPTPPTPNDLTVKYAKAGHEESKSIIGEQSTRSQDVITVAAVVCGNRVNEALVMIKSALIFSSTLVKFILFADGSATIALKKSIDDWPVETLNHLHLDLRPITFPSEKSDEWKKLFKLCASQRLFIPSLLEEVDSLLYMDTDTLFLTSPSKVWEHFSKMNNSHMAAMAPEHEERSIGWYNRFARHPYYGDLGVNSGVMLMNLTRMRQFGWEKYVIPVYQEYKNKITWGDQDIINIVFHFHPEKLYIYPCHYNYRPDHCMYMSICKPAEKHGVFVLHGSRGTFHNEKQPAFKAIYSSIEEYSFGEGSLRSLLTDMKEKLRDTMDTNCGKLMDFLTKGLENQIEGVI